MVDLYYIQDVTSNLGEIKKIDKELMTCRNGLYHVNFFFFFFYPLLGAPFHISTGQQD